MPDRLVALGRTAARPLAQHFAAPGPRAAHSVAYWIVNFIPLEVTHWLAFADGSCDQHWK